VLAAYKSGDLQDAVTRLQKLRATPVMTPQQRIALNDAMAAVMSEIYGLAAKGDARAIAAVKQYEELQTKPRYARSLPAGSAEGVYHALYTWFFRWGSAYQIVCPSAVLVRNL
jgi:hypothetical protein